jgi:hypothetical protein
MLRPVRVHHHRVLLVLLVCANLESRLLFFCDGRGMCGRPTGCIGRRVGSCNPSVGPAVALGRLGVARRRDELRMRRGNEVGVCRGRSRGRGRNGDGLVWELQLQDWQLHREPRRGRLRAVGQVGDGVMSLSRPPCVVGGRTGALVQRVDGKTALGCSVLRVEGLPRRCSRSYRG